MVHQNTGHVIESLRVVSLRMRSRSHGISKAVSQRTLVPRDSSQMTGPQAFFTNGENLDGLIGEDPPD